MRVVMVGVAAALAAWVVVCQATPATDSVEQILAAARKALGSEERLSAVRSFRLKGSIQTGQGSSKTYGSFDILCELPDKFVQRTTLTYLSPGQTASVGTGDTANLSGVSGSSRSDQSTRLGFNGDQVIAESASPVYSSPSTALASYTQDELRQRYLPQAKQAFVQTTLGMFAASFPGAPVRFLAAPTSAGDHAIVVSDRDDVLMTFDPVTHLPAALDTLHYSDYRDVDGIKVPFRLTRMVKMRGGGPPVPGEEWDVKEFRINVTINPKEFRPSGR